MPEGKSLKLGIGLDANQFAQVTQKIKELTAELQKMSQAASGLLGGGPGGFANVAVGAGAAPSKQQQGQQASAAAGGTQKMLGKVIIDNAAAFKKFAQEGKEASKVMTDALRRDITEQERSLDRLKNKLVDLNDEFKIATQKQKEFLTAGDTKGASAMERYIKTVEGRIADSSRETLEGSRTLEGSQQALREVTKPKWYQYGGSGLRNPEGGIAWGKLAALASVGMWGANEVREGGGGWFGNAYSGGGMDVRAEARRGNLINNEIRALRGGDITSLMVKSELAKPENRAKLNYYMQQTDKLAETGAYIKGAGQAGLSVLGNTPLLGPVIQGLASNFGVGLPKTALENLTTAEIQSKLYEAQQNTERDIRESPEFLKQQMAFEHFRSTLGSRTNAQRYGYTLHGFKVPGIEGTVGRYGDLAAWAAEKGVSPDQVIANEASLRQMSGSAFGAQMAKYETLSQAAGYSGFSHMAARAYRGVGAGGVDQAKELARAALGGGIEVGAGIALGNTLFGYDPRGTTSGTGMIGAVQQSVNWSGMSEGQQFNKVQDIALGMQAGDMLTTGGLDPESQAANTISAKRVLGQGASSRAIDTLAGTPFKQLVDMAYGNEPLTKEMRAYGVTRENIKQYVPQSMSNLLTSEVGMQSGEMRKVLVKAREAFKKGETPNFTPAEREMYDVGVSARFGGRAAIGATTAMSDIVLGGMKNDTKKSLKTGDALGPELSGPEAAEAKRKADEIRKDEENLRQQKNLETQISNAPKAAEVLSGFGTNLGSSVEQLSLSMFRLSGIIEKIITKAGGGGSGPMPPGVVVK
jgi:hypothetical protein